MKIESGPILYWGMMVSGVIVLIAALAVWIKVGLLLHVLPNLFSLIDMVA